jgi:peroxiredoxin family protein
LIILISSLYLAFFFDGSNIIVGLAVTVFITFWGVGIHTPEDVNEWEKKN